MANKSYVQKRNDKIMQWKNNIWLNISNDRKHNGSGEQKKHVNMFRIWQIIAMNKSNIEYSPKGEWNLAKNNAHD